MNVQQSKKGRWWIGPMPKVDSRWRYIGPYERESEAESDRVGISRFLKREK